MNKRLKELKSLIDNGSVPTIHEIAKIDSEDYTYMDLIAIEYGFVQDLYIGQGQFEKWFTYTGPEPIKINDLTLHSNEMIEFVVTQIYDGIL
tara:strand:+ start:252 stop:527 length:276 start_codon:yes stop_codon:yes gene_type:complete